MKTHRFSPLFFKETDLLKESDMLMPRMAGTLSGAIDLSSEIARIARARADRNYLRVESTIWQTLKGKLEINENGVRVDEEYPVQTQNALVDWDEFDTATPLRDFNAMKLKYRGTGASFQGAEAYINQTTANWLLQNNNPDDLKGYQNKDFLNLTFTIEKVNEILIGRGLPKLVVYDEGYYDSAGNFQLFLADGEVIVVGKRPAGQKIGDWIMTPSLHHAAMGPLRPESNLASSRSSK